MSFSRDPVAKGNTVVPVQTFLSSEIRNVGAITFDRPFRLEQRSRTQGLFSTLFSCPRSFLHHAPALPLLITVSDNLLQVPFHPGQAFPYRGKDWQQDPREGRLLPASLAFSPTRTLDI